jgi:hypothetical protein
MTVMPAFTNGVRSLVGFDKSVCIGLPDDEHGYVLRISAFHETKKRLNPSVAEGIFQ